MLDQSLAAEDELLNVLLPFVHLWGARELFLQIFMVSYFYSAKGWAITDLQCGGYFGRRKCYTASPFTPASKLHVPTKTQAESSSVHNQEILRTKAQNASSVLQHFIMNAHEVQFLSHFEDLSSNRFSVGELILWRLFSIDMTLWPKANCVKSNFSRRYPTIERSPISVCSRLHFLSSHEFAWKFLWPKNPCLSLQQAVLPMATLQSMGFLIETQLLLYRSDMRFSNWGGGVKTTSRTPRFDGAVSLQPC